VTSKQVYLVAAERMLNGAERGAPHNCGSGPSRYRAKARNAGAFTRVCVHLRPFPVEFGANGPVGDGKHTNVRAVTTNRPTPLALGSARQTRHAPTGAVSQSVTAWHKSAGDPKQDMGSPKRHSAHTCHSTRLLQHHEGAAAPFRPLNKPSPPAHLCLSLSGHAPVGRSSRKRRKQSCLVAA
jgi:hypothetical protein